MGDLDTMQSAINCSQHHVDGYKRRGRTSLHYACAHNHPDVVKLLLENNSSINIRDDEGCTPLIKAAQRDNIDCVSVLLDYNADPNLIDFSRNTAFHHAVSRGNLPIVQMFLKHNVDIEAKTEYGLTPLQLAAFEKKPEMVEFLEVMCANAHAPEEINGTGTPAQETKVKHISFNEYAEVFYFKDEKPLSREIRPPGQLKSILKSTSQYDTASEKTTRRTSLWCIKGDNVRHTSCDKEESNKRLRRLRKRMRNIFTKSEVYECSLGEPIPEICEAKTSLMEQRISVPELPAETEPTQSTSAADIGPPADSEPTPSTSAAYSMPPAVTEPTVFQHVDDSGAPGDGHSTCSTSAADIGARIDIEPISSTRAAESTATVGIELTSANSLADSGPRDDIEPTSTSAAYSMTSADVEPNAFQHSDDSGAPGDGHSTSTRAADIRDPIDVDATPSSCAACRGAPADIEKTPSQCAADSGAIADIGPSVSPGPADITELEEQNNSETASDIESDFISDLGIYMEDARGTPCADPESTAGPSACCSIDTTERADMNSLTLLGAEDKYDSSSLDEEPTPVPDLDEHLAPTQDDDVFYDALLSADHTGHSKTNVRDPGFLLAAEILLLPVRPVVWVLNHMFSMMTWVRNRFRQVWHEENGQGPPTNKYVEPVAAAADH